MPLRMTKFRDWGILTKIMAVSVLAVSVFVIGMFTYIIPSLEEKLTNEKREATKNVVDIAYSLITEYEARIKSGELTQAEAHKRALTRIRNLRYREKEYFWINDLGPKMIMHPYKPELDGKDLSDFKDPNGTFLFKEMVRVSNEKGEGFVDYQWPKPGMTQPVPKISYVKLYKPWGWIVGSGIYVDDVQAQIVAMRWRLIVGAMVVCLTILGLSFVVARRITKPLQEGVNLAGKLAEGDFTGNDIAVRSADEAGQLAEALNKMRGGLSTLLYSTMSGVSQTANQVATTSEELSATITQITRRVDEQSGRASQVAVAASEMSQTVADIAKNTTNIATSSIDTLKTAQNGEAIVGKTVNEVKEMAKTVSESAGLITSLGTRSKQIGEIVAVIRDIADQTNLLALNAAIEAARAGEMGRGFAVVADEVRKLAEKTGKATTEIGTMISSIQNETDMAVHTMEESLQRVEQGVELSQQAGDALRMIVGSVNDLQLMVQQIASATDEMATVSEQIGDDIEEIAVVSKETSTSTREIAEASQNLARLSSELNGLVSRYRLDSAKV